MLYERVRQRRTAGLCKAPAVEHRLNSAAGAPKHSAGRRPRVTRERAFLNPLSSDVTAVCGSPVLALPFCA